MMKVTEKSFHPVNTLQTRNLTEMFSVVSDYCEAVMTGGNGYENIHIANDDSLASECMTNLCVITNPITKRKNSESPFYLLGFFKMLFDSLAVKSAVCKFGNTYLRGKYHISRSLCYMFSNPTTMAEIFNPSVGIKDIPIHKSSIAKIYFTIKRTTIVAMLHHLIVFFSLLRFRPNACHFQELGFSLFCRKFRCRFLRHNQFICQPFTVALRE